MSREIVSFISVDSDDNEIINVKSAVVHIVECKRILKMYCVDLKKKDGYYAIIDNQGDYESIKADLDIL